jgi:hypothetical protein
MRSPRPSPPLDQNPLYTRRTRRLVCKLVNFLTSQFIRGGSFFILLFFLLVSTLHIQALLRQGFGIPSGNWKVKTKEPPRAHISPRDVLDLFYAHANSSEWGLIGHFARSAFRRTPSGRLICRGFLVKMQHKQHFFIQKLADVGKKTLPLQQNSIKTCR